ncbi:MAG: DoxX family protein [Actinomycetota bacterium]|nr:DoxX family protein [Actinomycetota bacterium]
MSIVRRIARPMLAAIFVAGGIDQLRHPGAKVGSASPLLDKVIPALGLPDDKEMLVRANGATMVAAGAMMATGRLPRVGGLLAALSMAPTTVAGHSFWEKSDPTERAQHRTQFLKNVAIIGGALMVAVDTDGRPGLAWRAHHAKDATRREARHVKRSAKRQAKIATQSAQLSVQDALR